MKSVHLPEHAADLRSAADAFLAGYGASLPEAHLVAELGCLLLARVDGKSPAEYLTEPEREAVRAIAKEVLRGRRSLAEAFQ
jgi:5-methylthioribose kinase